ncbi:alpha-amylase family glycosyl hydrolase [Streptococcus iniae]
MTTKADFSTDTIYQIITDRFKDGNPSNNGSSDVFDKNDLKKYHGGDWQGIIEKINDNYLTDMGITAIWISSPVENIDSIDPSNGSACLSWLLGQRFL